jgi:hypothetical protein
VVIAGLRSVRIFLHAPPVILKEIGLCVIVVRMAIMGAALIALFMFECGGFHVSVIV